MTRKGGEGARRAGADIVRYPLRPRINQRPPCNHSCECLVNAGAMGETGSKVSIGYISRRHSVYTVHTCALADI